MTGADYRRGHCRSCDAPIIWAVTTNGKAMPVDYDPDPGGNVELAPPPAFGSPLATVHAQRPLGGENLVLRLPHHATCPQADQWRNR